MSICRARLRNTSALTLQTSTKQIRLQVPFKLFGANSWIAYDAQIVKQWIPDCWPLDRKCTGSEGATSNWRNWQLVLATRNFGDWHTVLGEVPWSSVPKTMTDCHSKHVLHSLRGKF